MCIRDRSAFPKPLRPEEERELLLKKEAGDEGARNILIERNLRLVAHVVKTVSYTHLEYKSSGEEELAEHCYHLSRKLAEQARAVHLLKKIEQRVR